MPDVDLTFGGDGSPVKRAWEMSAEGCAEFISEVKKIVGASNAADNAQKQLGSTADRWLKQMETPLDSHLRRMGELQTLLQAGKIRQDQYTLGIQMSGKEMRAAEAAADTLGQTAKRILADQQSPQDQYNAKLEQYTELRKANKLTEDQFALAVSRARSAMEAQDAGLQSLKRDADKLRASLITPQTEYAEALKRANQLLQAEVISEGEYAVAVDNAKDALNAKDQSLQKMLSHAKRIREDAVTPEEAHTKAMRTAKQALDQKLISQKEFDNELMKQNQLLDRANAGSNSFFESVTGKSAEVLATMAGVGSVIGGLAAAASLLKSEYENLLESQKTAAEKQLDIAPAQRGAVFALGKDDTLSVEEMVAAAEKASLDYGIPLKNVYEAYGNAFSAKGQLTAQQAKESANVAMKTMPHSGATEIAGSLIGVKRRFGGNDEQLMGLNLAGQQVSRVKDAAAYATNVVPTIVGLGGYGNTAREATALPTAMSVSMEDLTGKQSATAIEKLAASLKLVHEKYKTGLTSTTEQIKFLWTDQGDKMRKELLGDGKGHKGSLDMESAAVNALTELLSKGQNKTKDAYLAAMRDIPELDVADVYYKDAMSQVNGLQLQRTSVIDRQHKTLAEQGSLHNESGARSAIAREGLDQSLQATGDWWISRFMTARMMDLNEFTGMEAPDDFAIRTLSDRSTKLRTPIQAESWGKPVLIQPDQRALNDADSIDRTVAKLKAVKAPVVEQANVVPQPKPAVSETVAKDGISDLTAALKENTAATVANSKKPPFVLKKSATNPTKTPVSAALQTLLKDADKSWR